MKRYFTISLYFAFLASVSLLCGCSQHKGTVNVLPGTVVLSPNVDNEVYIDVTLDIPDGYVSKRSMTQIEPVLILGDKVEQRLDPIIIQGDVYQKKEARLKQLYGYDPKYTVVPIKLQKNKNGMKVAMRENIVLPSNFDSGKVEAYITTDGCGECYGVDTVNIAYISNLSTLVDIEDVRMNWVDTILPPKVKSFEGQGVARIQFEVNRTEILPNLADNANEMGAMLKALTPVLKDSLATLNSMTIFGSASAEGIYDKNVKLAKDRAAAALDWIDSRLHLTPAQRRNIKIDSQPEGWEPVIAAMHAAGDADSALVKEIVQKYPDIKSGEAEKRIRKLKSWPRIANNYLAKDRRVIYNYKWTIKGFDTDDELMTMYYNRPDALDESEFLRVAHLIEVSTDGTDQDIQVYETMLKYIPNSEIALNNLAVLYYDNEYYDKAIALLEGQKKLTDDMKNTLALAYIGNNDVDKAIHLLYDADNEDAKYNLGSILASTHRMAEAYKYLQGAEDVNAAIAALGVNENKEALRILDSLDDDTPLIDYVRAIALTRLGQHDDAIASLKSAVTDPDLKERAATEADFAPLYNMTDFINLFNQ